MGLPKDSGLTLRSKHPSGKRNLITDVPGVRVGHVTIQEGEINTGVTAILPHGGNLFKDKVMAGASVINGFGKSAGLVQVDELGTIETPILMTNTLSVGTALTALVRYMLKDNEDIGVTTGTVNGVVTECNDGRLNDIRGLHVREEHVWEALEKASKEFEEGAVGGGTGMCCLGLKGGIGSASRTVEADGQEYTVGAIVMANFGSAGNLVIGGDPIGARILERQEKEKTAAEAKQAEEKAVVKVDKIEEAADEKKDQGSIIMVIATDLPLNERQLRRVAHRSMIALGRVGSYCGNGSGDIAIAFSTANRLPHYSEKKILPIHMFYDEEIDSVFEASVEAVEEAIISALYHAKTTTGVRGNTYYGLRDYL